MIESISIKDIGSYDGVGVQISGLKKINFIYGANGSGKTIISNFVANHTDTEYQNCDILWQHNQPLNELVYNKKFRENNFGKGTIEGVFTLGEATKKDIEFIEKKQLELKKLKDEGIQKKRDIRKTRKDQVGRREFFQGKFLGKNLQKT